MSIDSRRVETILFDSFSTVVDVHSVEQTLADHVEDPARVSRRWRSQVWAYRPLCNFLGWKTHHEINRSALEYVFEIEDVDATADELDEIARSYYEMEPFDDTYAGMKRLSEAGYDLYILSNGDQAVLDAMVENAGIGELIEDEISADEIKLYKPHVRLYKHAARRSRTPVDNIALASAAWPDVQGGLYAGMQGVWVNREDKPPGLKPFDGDPHLVVEDFHEMADEFGVRGG